MKDERKALDKLEAALAKTRLSLKSQRKIMDHIRTDNILPMMLVPQHTPTSVRIENDIVYTSIGARDMDFDLSGNRVGSGTDLQMAKWKNSCGPKFADQ